MRKFFFNFTQFFLCFVLLFCGSLSAQDCLKQENVKAEYKKEEVVINIPAYRIMVAPAVLDTVMYQVCIKEAGVEEYISCEKDGTFKKCTRTIEAEYITVAYLIEKTPAKYVDSGGGVSRIEVQKLVRNGYIRNVPCDTH